MQKNIILSQKRQRQRRENTEPITLLIYQLPLTKKDLNVDKILTFTLVLKKGHKKYTILKGKENFYINI